MDPKSVPRAFAALALLMGAGYAVLMPPFQVPDEFEHFSRAYEVSQGHFLSRPGLELPGELVEFSNRFPPRLLSGTAAIDPVRKADLMPFLHARPGEPLVRVKWSTGAINSPVPYLPAALALLIGRVLGASPLALLYLGRLFSLAVYVLLTYLALRLAALGTAMACTALLPMTLHQAASFSADAVAFASTFLLLGYVARLAVGQSIKLLLPRHYLVLGGLICLSALCKPNPWIYLLVLLIPPARFGSRRRWLISTAIFTAAGLLTIAGWQTLNRENVKRYAERRAGRAIDLQANMRLLASHPGATGGAIIRTLKADRSDLEREFVGEFGALQAPLPIWAVRASLILLLFAAVHSAEPLRMWQRLLLVGIAAASASAVFIFQEIIELPAAYVHDFLAGTGTINSVQGRYLIPIAPMLLMALSGGPRLRRPRGVAAVCLGAAGILGVIGLAWVWKTYYVAKPDSTDAGPNNTSIGIVRNGVWRVRAYVERGDREIRPSGWLPNDVPVAGDWNGNGRAQLGLFRKGEWILDTNGDGNFDSRDTSFYFGGLPEDIPVTGDWNGDGKTKAGIYRNGIWILDFDGRRTEKGSRVFAFGGIAGDIPVAGDWNGDGKTKVGVFRKGFWLLDFNGRETEQGDRVIPFGGIPGDLPVVADWSGRGRSGLGIYRHGTWILDSNGDYRMDEKDREFPFGEGAVGETPVVLISRRK
jgi:Predicted membrane protein (DUF2142)